MPFFNHKDTSPEVAEILDALTPEERERLKQHMDKGLTLQEAISMEHDAAREQLETTLRAGEILRDTFSGDEGAQRGTWLGLEEGREALKRDDELRQGLSGAWGRVRPRRLTYSPSITGSLILRETIKNSPRNAIFYCCWGAAAFIANSYGIRWLVWLLATPTAVILVLSILQFILTSLLGMFVVPVDAVRALFSQDWEALKDQSKVLAALTIQLIENLVYVALLIGFYRILFTEEPLLFGL